MVKVDERVFGPDLLAQFFPANEFARMREQDGADLKRLALQRHLCPILAQLSSL